MDRSARRVQPGGTAAAQPFLHRLRPHQCVCAFLRHKINALAGQQANITLSSCTNCEGERNVLKEQNPVAKLRFSSMFIGISCTFPDLIFNKVILTARLQSRRRREESLTRALFQRIFETPYVVFYGKD